MILFNKCMCCGVFVSFLGETLASACNVDNWNVDYYPSSSNYVKLTCKKKSQLTAIEVVAGKIIFDEKYNLKTVYGRTPSLIARTQQCFWSQNCSFAFPEDIMVTCVTIICTESKGVTVQEYRTFSSTSCFLEDAQFLRPVHAKCIKAKTVKTFFEKEQGKRFCTKKFRRNKGLIKSHDSYPWYYNDYRNVTGKSKFPLRKRDLLVIEIKFVHVCEGDQLIIRTKKGEVDISDVKANEHLAFNKREHKFVELQFRVASDSNGCGGFLICYRVVKENLNKYDWKIRNVCDELYDRDMPNVTTSLVN